jgi:hypothetical protein
VKLCQECLDGDESSLLHDDLTYPSQRTNEYRAFRMLHLSCEHLFDSGNNEIGLLKLDVVPAVGSNDVDAVRGEAR